jgi:hypothetical protein
LKEIDIDKSPVSVFPELTAALSDEMEKQIIELDQLEQISLGLNRRDSQRPANEGVSCP